MWWCREGDCVDRVNLTIASRALKLALSEGDALVLRELVRSSKTVVVVEE